MKTSEFKRYLVPNHTNYTKVSLIRRVEENLNIDIDLVVSSDEGTYKLLKELRQSHSWIKEKDTKFANAVRSYYKFINNKDFPTLRQYESKEG